MRTLPFLFVLALVSAPQRSQAEVTGSGFNAWMGGMGGKQTMKANSTFNPPIAYGGTAGLKLGPVGLGGFYTTTTKTTSVAGVPLSVDVEMILIGAQFDFMPLGKYIYAGIRGASMTQKATFSGSAAASMTDSQSSSYFFGAGGGVNIPFLVFSLGADVMYLKGTASGYGANIVSYMGTVKIWI